MGLHRFFEAINFLKSLKIGKIASKRCEERGITVQKINDARWGKFNIYPEEFLDSLKNEFIRRAG
jgi:hypothetical protein